MSVKVGVAILTSCGRSWRLCEMESFICRVSTGGSGTCISSHRDSVEAYRVT